MSASEQAKNLSTAYENLKQEMEEFFEPHVKAWVKVQVNENKLTQEEADRDFTYSEDVNNGICFASEDWEETWQYGGYEKHYGREIVIPFDFFDNPDLYVKKAELERKAAEAKRKAESLAYQQAEVARLQRQLELAQERLESK